MRVFLVGFMGSGKTTVGAALARARDWEFVDLDAWVERRAGCSVREIFARRGEAFFRTLEHEALRTTEEAESVVVATGGGTFTFPRNREVIRRLGTSVFLHPSFATILRRLDAVEKEERPLFRTEAEALALYRKRLPAYRQADLVVEVGADETARQTAARLGAQLRETRGGPCDT